MHYASHGTWDECILWTGISDMRKDTPSTPVGGEVFTELGKYLTKTMHQKGKGREWKARTPLF